MTTRNNNDSSVSFTTKFPRFYPTSDTSLCASTLLAEYGNLGLKMYIAQRSLGLILALCIIGSIVNIASKIAPLTEFPLISWVIPIVFLFLIIFDSIRLILIWKAGKRILKSIEQK